MPPKKRQSLTGLDTKTEQRKKICYDAKRYNDNRNSEPIDERIQRQAQDSVTHAATRAVELPVRRSQRLAKDVAAHAAVRALESPLERSNRQSQDAISHRQRRAQKKPTFNAAVLEDIDELSVTEFYCGTMNEICKFCNSLNFKREKPHDNKFSQCCHKGKVNLETLKPVPHLLKDLMTGKHAHSSNFMENIRSYNSALAFASMGAQIDIPTGYGPFCFKVHGQIYHSTSSLHPAASDQPKYAQLYILDAAEALSQRMSITQNLKCIPALMQSLDLLIKEVNPFAQAYKMMREVELEEEQAAKSEGRSLAEISMILRKDNSEDQRRFNAPRINEVAIIFKNADGEPPANRDILTWPKQRNQLLIPLRCENRTQRINTQMSICDPMTYPIIFPFGEHSWHDDIQQIGHKHRVTQLQYYSYRLAIRPDFNPILNAGKLTQQYIVDSYVKVEANRIQWVKQNQKQLRVDNYSGLMDHINHRAENAGIKAGKPVILPSSFLGSPRAMQQNYQDAMAIVRKYGKPDLFITMTCNPKWNEIVENLETWQKAENRPDLIARVFHLKLKELLADLMDRHIFGIPSAKIHVIEFQKRGLPHAHILLILNAANKPRSREQIDKFVCAEIPHPETHPRLHQIVMKSMIHGPCGNMNPSSPCMNENKCTKDFPKQFETETRENVQGYPRYRRRDNGGLYKTGKYIVNNAWVVPYNPFLSLKYNCHINVEICASIKGVKYLFKYIYKGHDCANIEFRTNASGGSEQLNWDEVASHLDARYVSPPEACWRLFEYRMSDQSHPIVRLAVHLPQQQPVYFTEGDEEEAAISAADKNTTLTAWFKLNNSSPAAQQFLYTEIPDNYVFNSKSKTWKPRQRGNVISRMFTVSVNDSERYFLRLLLLNVRGSKSFLDLKTVEGILYESFKDAAIARHLLADDSEWDRCLCEAEFIQMPEQLRELFAIICIFGNPSNASKLFESHVENFTEDYCRNHSPEISQHLALRDIQNTLLLHGKRCNDFGLQTPSTILPNVSNDAINHEEAKRNGEQQKLLLNAEQLSAFCSVIAAVDNPSHSDRLFFLDGPGGTGKTFLYNTLINFLIGRYDKVLAVASTGIASTLLLNGRTYHSQFKLYPPITDTTSSQIKSNTKEADLIRNAKLIIWDEVTMTPSHALNAVDKLFKELMDNDTPFGGKVVLLGGDFRQCLPVVKHAHRVAIVQSTIKSCPLWTKFLKLQLKQNMRANLDELEFAEWLIQLGNGQLTNVNGLYENIIEIPIHFVQNMPLINSVFGDKVSKDNVKQFSDRAILTPKNEDSLQINQEILNKLEGDFKNYLSVDTLETNDEQERINYPVEFLNTIHFSGMPPHKLHLKVGAIIMLLRNLNSKKGLCNGTRMIVINLHDNVIDAEVLTGKAKGLRVFIPRIDLVPTDTDYPFLIRRRQFPIIPAFAMTINKSQGQTFSAVGIYLPQPVFSHGQLYVAFSRATSARSVSIDISNTESQGKLIERSDKLFTLNCVFKEVL